MTRFARLAAVFSAATAFALGQSTLIWAGEQGQAASLDGSSNTLSARSLSGTAGAAAASKPASAMAMPEFTVQAKSEYQKLDEARDMRLLPKLGATAYGMDQKALQALPQGANTPLDKVLLQAPGVSYDSAISNPDFHVRNEYANVQYRVNGIQLPDGVSALGPVLETGFVGKLSLLDGALPAQYGLRTAGVVDITTKADFDQGGDVDVYAGTWGTLSPSFQVGGHAGSTQYFFTGRYMQSQQGLENAMPTADPIHDGTTQEKFFGYASTLLGDSSRLTYMAGAFVGQFQIPDVSGAEPMGDYGPASLDSTRINDNEYDQFYFGVLALQTHGDRVDTQWSVYSRYAAIHFVPDVTMDLAYNDVASDVSRKSLLGGVQFDGSDRLTDAQTLRVGLDLSAEETHVDDVATVLPDSGGTISPDPEALNDYTPKLGVNAGAYLQDEWRMLQDLTLNVGLRFDQMDQFTTGNQLSPRVALAYKPFDGTTLHAGMARYFTPPMQAQSTPSNLALFQNTTQQPVIPQDDPALPERATYYDVGWDQDLPAGFSTGVDTYYKASTDTLDDGQFGQAVVLEQFNYAYGYSEGAELKLNFARRGLRAYANASCETTMVEDIVSNEYLIDDPAEFAYTADHYTPSSDSQKVSASWGGSYHWRFLFASLDGMYGSGLAAGFANEQNSPAYAQWNAAVGASCAPWGDGKPLTLRVSANNLFDVSYILREADGIGEFASQYGPRRAVFTELTQQF
ncbi:MAG TPA: TonB-dependent receptor [bacterium]|nr:TonB-dependent receptor [bacterium]